MTDPYAHPPVSLFGMPPPRPIPPPPPPPRHPDLWGDPDAYTRKEIDDLVASSLVSAKAYTDGSVASIGDAVSGAAAAAEEAVAAASGAAGSASGASGLAAQAAECASGAMAAASGAAALTSGLVVESGTLWYYSAVSSGINAAQWKRFKAKSSGNGSITAGEFAGSTITGIDTTSGHKEFSSMWFAEDGVVSGDSWGAGLSGGRLEIYRLGSGDQLWSGTPSVVQEDLDSVTVGAKVFANYRGNTTEFHWTSAPYRVKVSDIGFQEAFDPEA